MQKTMTLFLSHDTSSSWCLFYFFKAAGGVPVPVAAPYDVINDRVEQGQRSPWSIILGAIFMGTFI